MIKTWAQLYDRLGRQPYIFIKIVNILKGI